MAKEGVPVVKRKLFIDFAKQRATPIEKALAETRAMGFDGFAGDFAAEHFGHENQEWPMRRSAAFCRRLLQ